MIHLQLHQIKTGTNTNADHSGTFTIADNEKHLLVVERDGGEMLHIYKNGLKYVPEEAELMINSGNFDLISLGVKNVTSATNFFDGIMYDVIFVDEVQSAYQRKRIEDYLLKKHKLQRLCNG